MQKRECAIRRVAGIERQKMGVVQDAWAVHGNDARSIRGNVNRLQHNKARKNGRKYGARIFGIAKPII